MYELVSMSCKCNNNKPLLDRAVISVVSDIVVIIITAFVIANVVGHGSMWAKITNDDSNSNSNNYNNYNRHRNTASTQILSLADDLRRMNG